MITANTIQLILAFKDGSKQEEKSQPFYVDRLLEERRYLDDHKLGISAFAIPPISEKIGRFKLVSKKVPTKDEILNGMEQKLVEEGIVPQYPCSTAEVDKYAEYWAPILGEELFDLARDFFQCFDLSNAYLQGA